MAKTSRPLVRGYLERISVKAFDKYHAEITDLVRAFHGVYALYKNDRLYYVGLASNLRRRVKQHLKDRHAGKWNYFSLYLVRKVDHIREIESLILRIADPSGNKQTGKLRRATNLQRQLRSAMADRQRLELDEIFRNTRRKKKSTSRRTPGRKKKTRGRRTELTPLKKGVRVFRTYRGKDYKAAVRATGRVRFNGKLYDSPTAAAKAITKRPVNGWVFWRVRKNGELVTLKTLRK